MKSRRSTVSPRGPRKDPKADAKGSHVSPKQRSSGSGFPSARGKAKETPQGKQALAGETPRRHTAAAAAAATVPATPRPGGECPVCVVVHVRPLVEKEVSLGCSNCLEVRRGKTEVSVPTADKVYAFDHVFGEDAHPSKELYPMCVAPLVDGLFSGYNATVLAYGQTGTGKTYTMGTGLSYFTASKRMTNSTALEPAVDSSGWVGVVPMVMDEVFSRVSSPRGPSEGGGEEAAYVIRCSFVEVYNNLIRDLLNRDSNQSIELRESNKENVQILGVREEVTATKEEMMHWLIQGMSYRATSGTQMNMHSSRSHGIFSISIEQKRTLRVLAEGEDDLGLEDGDDATLAEESLTAKMHLVDLAGSERIKKSGASGTQQKEAACINLGLLNLRNVIEALVMKSAFVPYRSNKLTRLLQDSLGGNSRTLFVACCSPADYNMDETLSTLLYASEARKIKNKPVANRDKHSEQLAALTEELRRVREELFAMKHANGEDGFMGSTLSGSNYEANGSQEENNRWRFRATVAEARVAELSSANAALEAQVKAHSGPRHTLLGSKQLRMEGAAGSDLDASGADDSMLSESFQSSTLNDTTVDSLDAGDLEQLEGKFRQEMKKGQAIQRGHSGHGTSNGLDGSDSEAEMDLADGGVNASRDFFAGDLPRPLEDWDGQATRALPPHLFDLLGESALRKIQLDHDAAELSRKIHTADSARARLQALEGSVLNPSGTGTLPPPALKKDVRRWIDRSASLENQEQELDLMLEAELSRRASLAAELRAVQANLDARDGPPEESEEDSQHHELTERLASLEEELGCKSADIAELQRLQLAARERRAESGRQGLHWVSDQDLQLVASAAYRTAVGQRSTLLEMQAEMSRLRGEVAWRERVMAGLEEAVQAGQGGLRGASKSRGTQTLDDLLEGRTSEPQLQSARNDMEEMQSQIGALEQEVSMQMGVLGGDLITLCELADGADDRATPAAALLGTLGRDPESISTCGPAQVAALAGLLSSKAPAARSAGAACLGAVASLGAEQAAMVAKANAIPQLLSFLPFDEVDPQAQVSAAIALEAIAHGCHEDAREALMGGLEDLVAMLKDASRRVAQAAAASCLAALLKDPRVVTQVLKMDAVGLLAAVLSAAVSGQPDSGCWSAAEALSVLAETEQDVNTIQECGGVEALTALLEAPKGAGGAGGEASAASLALALCRWPSSRQAVAESSALPALVRYLWVEGPTLAGDYACRAIRLLVTSADPQMGRSYLVRAGGVFALLNACGSGSAVSREAAARSLESLASTPAVKEVLGRVGCIPALVSLLRARMQGGRAVADQQSHRSVAFAGRVAAVCALTRLISDDAEPSSPSPVSSPSESECTSPAMSARSGSSFGTAVQQMLGSKNGKRVSALSVWKAALLKDNRMAVVKAAGERGIVELMVTTDGALAEDLEGVHAACAECLKHLVATQQCRPSIVAAGAVPPLMKILCDAADCDLRGKAHPQATQAAMESIENLTGSAEARSIIMEGGGIATLSALLQGQSSSMELRSHAATALAVLLEQPGSCALFLREGEGLERLLHIVEHGSCDEQVAAMTPIRAMASLRDDVVSSTIVAAGAVGRLVKAIARACVSGRRRSMEESGNSQASLARVEAVAAGIIYQLSACDDGAVAIATSSGLQVLLEALVRQPIGSPLEVPVVGVLVHCIQNEQVKECTCQAAITGQAIPHLGHLLKAGNLRSTISAVPSPTPSQRDVLRLLVAIASVPGGAASILQAKAAVPLVSLLASVRASSASRLQAAGLIQLLAQEKGGASTLVAAGATAPLLRMVCLPDADTATNEAGARAVLALARASGARRERIWEEVACSTAPEALTRHLGLTEMSPRAAAAEAMSAVVGGAQQWQKVVDSDGIRLLEALLLEETVASGPDAEIQQAGQAAAASCLSRIASHEATVPALIEAGTLGRMVGLLGTCGLPVILSVLETLGGMVAAAPDHEAIAQSEAPRRVVALIAHETSDVRMAAAEVLEQLACADVNKVAIREAGGIGPLLGMLEAGHFPEEHVAAARVLENMALDDENKLAIPDAGGLAPLVANLACSEKLCKIACAKVLTNLALDAANREPIASAGAVPLLVEMLGEGDEDVQEAASGLVENLALSPVVGTELALSGAIPRLVAMLSSPSVTNREEAAGAIENLSLKPNLRVATTEAGAVPPLVKMLESSEPGEPEAAAGALQNLANDPEGRVVIAKAGGIAGLVRLLEAGGPGAQETAAGALGNLALNADNRGALVKQGGVPLLVRLLGSGTVGGKEAAAGAIENMSLDDSSCRLITDEGAVELLVRMLNDDTDSLKEAAAAALRRLSSRLDEVTLSIASAGGVALLVNLLRSGTDSAQEAAAATLERLSTGPEQMVAIAKVGGLGALLNLIQNGNSEAIEAAARTIGNFAQSQHNSSAIQAMGGVPILLDLLQNGDDAGKEGAARVLQNMALTEENRCTIAELGAIPAIKNLILAGSESGREAAIGAVENLALTDSNRVRLMDEGVIGVLVEILWGVRGKGCQRAATRALITLASNDMCKEKIAQDGAVRPLVHLLSSNDEVLQEAAARALQNLSLRDENRAIIAAEGGIPPLLSFLELGNLDMKEVAARTLWSLAVLGENREAIVRAGGIALLLNLMRSGNESGKEAAAGALQNLAIDEDISIAVERGGGLHLMVDLLSSNELACREAGAGALQNLVLNDHNRESEAASRAVPMLVEMLCAGSGLEREASAGALRNLAMSDRNCERIVRAGAVPLLLDMLSSDDESAQEVAAGTLENLLLTEGQELVAAREVVPPLVVLLLHGVPAVVDAAVGALEAAAKSPEDRLLIGSLGAIPRLVGILSEKDEPASVALALGLVEALATVPGNASAMVRAGLLAPVVEILSAPEAEGKDAAAGVLCNLALSQDLRGALVAAGVVRPLLALLQSEQSTAVEAAATALKNITLVDEGVREVTTRGGSSTLCEALERCGNSAATAEVSASLLEVLGRIDRDAHKRMAPKISPANASMMSAQQNEAGEGGFFHSIQRAWDFTLGQQQHQQQKLKSTDDLKANPR